MNRSDAATGLTCTGAASCTGGDKCCIGVGGGAGFATSCAATCAANEQVCSGDAECAPGTCMDFGGGFGICTAARTPPTPPTRDAGPATPPDAATGPTRDASALIDAAKPIDAAIEAD